MVADESDATSPWKLDNLVSEPPSPVFGLKPPFNRRNQRGKLRRNISFVTNSRLESEASSPSHAYGIMPDIQLSPAAAPMKSCATEVIDSKSLKVESPLSSCSDRVLNSQSPDGFSPRSMDSDETHYSPADLGSSSTRVLNPESPKWCSPTSIDSDETYYSPVEIFKPPFQSTEVELVTSADTESNNKQVQSARRRLEMSDNMAEESGCTVLNSSTSIMPSPLENDSQSQSLLKIRVRSPPPKPEPSDSQMTCVSPMEVFAPGYASTELSAHSKEQDPISSPPQNLLVRSSENNPNPAQDTLARSYDRLPRWRSTSPKFPYKRDAVRKRCERMKLQGWTCWDCKEAYKVLGMDSKAVDNCSRHRAKYNQWVDTPEGYWRTDFPSTQSVEMWQKKN